MQDNRSAKDEELYRRTDEVLHYLWDPCGISDAPEARDEYYSYLPSVYSLLHDGADADKIASLLKEIEGKHMGPAIPLATKPSGCFSWNGVSTSTATRPNNAFKPTPLRYAQHMAGTACHVLGSTTRRGLT